MKKLNHKTYHLLVLKKYASYYYTYQILRNIFLTVFFPQKLIRFCLVLYQFTYNDQSYCYSTHRTNTATTLPLKLVEAYFIVKLKVQWLVLKHTFTKITKPEMYEVQLSYIHRTKKPIVQQHAYHWNRVYKYLL